MSCNCTESKMCLACGPAKSAKHRPSDTGGAIQSWPQRLDLRAALASKGDTGGDLSAGEDKARYMWTSLFTNTGTRIKFALATDICSDVHTMAVELLGTDELDPAKVYEVAILKRADYADLRATLATAPRAAIPARDAVLEEAAQAVVGMGSTDPIMSYGQLCAEAIRALKGVAAIPAAGSSAFPKEWQNDVSTAYRCVRKYNNTIPDDTLDMMREILLAAPTATKDRA